MSSYSMDLRVRVVEAYQRGEGTYKELAERFGVSYQSVGNWCRRFTEEGHCEPRPHGGRGPESKADPVGLAVLVETLEHFPEATLVERKELYREHTGVGVSTATMQRWVQELGWTHKKKSRGR